MKYILCVMFVLAICFSANAQDMKETDVPASVKAKFSLLYPEAKDVRWEKENGNYEAEMDQSKTEISVLFDGSGNLIQTEKEIALSDVPRGIIDYATQNFRSQKINEATRIVDASGVVTYEAEIGNIEYLFDAGGKFLKKDSGSDDNGKDDDDK